MPGRVAGLRGLKVIALSALVAASLLGGVGPAVAHDDDGSWRHRERGWGEHGRDRHDRRDDARREAEWREREYRRRQEWREREAWRHHERRERYGWGAPPVVYAPPAPAGFEFSVNIPIY
ncbi:MAG TPA: hypothetical protein VD978_19780 [Azospirillum sp.]|nr:hypothetical protein [Azospirillum sp.]